MLNVAAATAKWARNVQGGQQSYKDGIQGTTENPMQLAAAKADVALANYTEAISSGRWANKLANTPVEVWKQNSINAAGRWASGVQKGTPKVQAHLTKFAPVYEQAKQAARAIQGTGESAASEKMLAARRILRAAAGKTN